MRTMVVQEALELGAFDLKRVANRNLLIAFIIALLLHVILLGYPTVAGMLGGNDGSAKENIVNSGPVTLKEFQEEELEAQEEQQQDAIPPPPPMAATQEIGTGAAERMGDIVATSEEIDAPDVADISTMTIATPEGGGDGGAPPFNPDDLRVNEDRQREAEAKVSDQPTYPEFVPNAQKPSYNSNELMGNVRYPQIAEENGLEGTVYVQASIDENGNVARAVVIRSENEIFNTAAVEAVKRTQFSPAIQNNYAIKMKITIPIRFRLQ